MVSSSSPPCWAGARSVTSTAPFVIPVTRTAAPGSSAASGRSSRPRRASPSRSASSTDHAPPASSRPSSSARSCTRRGSCSSPCGAALDERRGDRSNLLAKETTHALRHLLRAPAAAPVGRGRRAQALPGRARPGRAGRPARHRLRLGGRAPFPRGILPLPPPRGLPRPPHPPLWVACSNRETIHLAAQLGMGALTFAFIDPAEAAHWIADYYDTFKRECVPIGHTVNPNVAMVTGFSCHADATEAGRRGTDGFRFFQFALGHHYSFGKHTPGRTDIWKKFVAVRDQLGLEMLGGGTGCIGTPAQLTASLRQFETNGVDQTIFIQQGGNNQHEHICESLELFAREVMPEFKERDAARQARKMEELGPYIEAAFARKQAMPPLAERDIPTYEAYGLTVAEVDLSKMPEANRLRYLAFRKMREIAERS